jgi:hypothetical protein
MKKTTLKFNHFITLVEEGRYEYTRDVDASGNSHFYRTYRAGDTIVSEEVDRRGE